MKAQILHIKHFANVNIRRLSNHCRMNGYKYVVLFLIGFILSGRDFEIHIHLKNPLYSNSMEIDSSLAVNSKKPDKILTNFQPKNETDKRYLNYIANHIDLARSEMHKHGTPASVKLAQGLLETNGGKSTLAKVNNNHFGIKCFSKSCSKGHCSNFNDDSHKDFFRIYESTKDSYSAHSEFLKKERYRHLFELKKSDYKSWCYGLKKAGYATDPEYPKKLIRLIERYELHKYDR